MSRQLVDNIYKMNNAELIGLAKNRFLPSEIQLAIAKTGYTRSHWYLAENPGLSKETRDFMWSDACNRGYSLKAIMVTYGHYVDDPDRIRELYDRYPSAWNRSSWRMSAAFAGSYACGETGTPPDLLNRIYDERYAPDRPGHPKMDSRGHFYSGGYELARLAKHKNIDLELAIKLSQCGIPEIEKLGFAQIVNLSR